MHSGPLTDVIVAGVGLLTSAALPLRTRLFLLCTFARLARRPQWLVLAGTAATVFAARLCLLPILPQPKPIVPDEFSHLFLAQTLASGRLSNPTHPMWRHFETLFVLQRPTYASPYPPLEGGLLATGLVLAGNAWFGVLLSVAAMCAAIVWMLQAYVTRFWALYGGVLAGAGYAVLSYWTNTYWGGAGAALGGALVFGALPRIAVANRLRDAAALATGFLFLAYSRPYEGFLLCLPVAGWLAWRCTRRRRGGAPSPGQALVLAVLLFAAALVTCWYNWRVTGSPFRLPYSAYIQQYAAAPAFLWQRPPAIPEYRDRVLRDAHLSFRADYAALSTFSQVLWTSVERLAKIAAFYFGPFWPIALALIPNILRQPRRTAAYAPGWRLLFLAVALCLAGMLLTVSFHLHYAAPCTSILILLLVEAFRRVRLWSRTVGACLLISAAPSWIAVQVLNGAVAHLSNSLEARPAILSKLTGEGGRHLVFVHYGPSHRLGEEWIYNEPDIDHAVVIWARDLGPEMNQELTTYFPTRQAWLLEPDEVTVRLSRCASPQRLLKESQR